MPTTLAEVGRRTVTGYANVGDLYQTSSRSVHGFQGYKAVEARKEHRLAPIPELSESYKAATGAYYVYAKRPARSADRYIVLTAFLRAPAHPRLSAIPRIEPLVAARKTALLSSRLKTAARSASFKAFTMHLKHLEFLSRASTGPDCSITPETASLARSAWRQIWLASGRALPVPSACTNADGKVSYSWDTGRYHLDLDIVPGMPAEFFFCDRETDRYWCEDYRIGGALPAKVVAKLSLFSLFNVPKK
jgi:hypothetical protein